MKEFKLVTKKLSEIIPDPDQPRKTFDMEKIRDMASSIKAQGIINPIEIDENNIIITGEMRYRSAKEAGLEEIACKVFEGMDKWERLERQTIENLHHNLFTSEERENVITKLWKSDKYKSKEELGEKLGIGVRHVYRNLKAYEDRKGLEKNGFATEAISTSSMEFIGALPKSYQGKVISKIEKGEIKPSEIQTFVSSIREMPSDIKMEILKPETEITLDQAIEIAQVQDPTMRKESIEFIKKQKRDQDMAKEYVMDIARGEIEPYEEIKEDFLDEKIIDQSIDLRNKIRIKWRKKNIETFREQTQVEIEKIIRDIQDFLRDEWGERTQIIEIRRSDREVINLDEEED